LKELVANKKTLTMQSALAQYVQGMKYLGVQVRYWLPIEANFDKLMLSLKGKLMH
jgi:hypothetical protein